MLLSIKTKMFLFENLTSDQLQFQFISDDPQPLSDDSSYFVGRTGEIISHTYYINTKNGFDPSLLKLKFSWFLNSQLLDHVIYDGETIHDVDICAHRYEEPIAGIIVNF